MYTEERDDTNLLINIIRDDGASIPLDESNVDYQDYLVWKNSGNTPDIDVNVLSKIKRMKIDEFVNEAISRIAVQVPEWDTYEKVKLVVSLFQSGLLNAGSAGPEHVKAKDIYVFVKSTVLPDINSMVTVSEIQGVDVVAYPGWPA